MSWGNSSWSSTWGSNNGGNTNEWGQKSLWSSGHTESHEYTANGTHNRDCMAGRSLWPGSKWTSHHYEAHCTGCQRDRASTSLSSHKGNVALTLLSLFTGAKASKKLSIWK